MFGHVFLFCLVCGAVIGFVADLLEAKRKRDQKKERPQEEWEHEVERRKEAEDKKRKHLQTVAEKKKKNLANLAAALKKRKTVTIKKRLTSTCGFRRTGSGGKPLKCMKNVCGTWFWKGV